MTESTHKRRLPAYFYKGSVITGLILIVVFAAGAVLLLTNGGRLQTFLGSVAGLPTAGNGARLLLTPSSSTVTVGQNFTVTVALNGGNDSGGTPNQVLTTGAYLTYDKTKLSVDAANGGVDTSTSVFTTGIIESNSDCTSNCRWDSTTGKINISAAQASPGVSGSNLTVAVIHFTANATGTASVNFDFTTARASNSQVIVWDAANNAPADILDGVTNGSYVVNVAAPTGTSTVTPVDSAGASSVSANTRSTGTIRFAYTAVSGATTYKYTVYDTANGEPAVGSVTNPITASPCATFPCTAGQITTVTGLSLINGHTYKVKVVPSNAGGSSTASSLSAAIKTASGDINHDGVVNFVGDFQNFSINYGKTYTNTSTMMPDINGDGTVNFADLAYLALSFGQTL